MPDEAPTPAAPHTENYELSPRPPTPKLPGNVALREDVDALVDAVAADLYVQAQNCVRTFGDFQLALSGGSTPVALYQRLMIDPALREFPWTRTHLWIVDERRVPFDDDRSNYKMINEIIGEHSGIPPEQVHPILATADDADARYTQALREVLGWREKGHDRLDYTLLGMGNDAHTASLFPHSPALMESLEAMRPRSPGDPIDLPLVRINSGPTVTPPDRVTMMLPLINASRFIGVLVTGSGKRETVRAVAARASDPTAPADLPILGVRALGGELRWYLDYAACPDVAARS
ncbi:MAG TPA: 6-phosphogluconolactonase [Phycisphaerales bacterium]|nr:6-phosphogluconolactonase [Phycisphaerales bacterium]